MHENPMGSHQCSLTLETTAEKRSKLTRCSNAIRVNMSLSYVSVWGQCELIYVFLYRRLHCQI